MTKTELRRLRAEYDFNPNETTVRALARLKDWKAWIDKEIVAAQAAGEGDSEKMRTWKFNSKRWGEEIESLKRRLEAVRV